MRLVCAAVVLVAALAASACGQIVVPSPTTSGGRAIETTPPAQTAPPITSPPATSPASPAVTPTAPATASPGQFTGRTVPILMYHKVDPTPGSEGEFSITPHRFEQEMDWLADNGFHAVTLHQVWLYWQGQWALPANPIVISFDDGFPGQVTYAAPILKELGWPAVLNVVVAYIGEHGILTPEDIRTLIGDGWEIDSHTRTHPILTQVSASRLWHEVNDSRTALQHMFNIPVDFFCYPGGAWNAQVVAAVKQAGYLGATGVQQGPADPSDMYVLDRIHVYGTNVLSTFVRNLEYYMAH